MLEQTLAKLKTANLNEYETAKAAIPLANQSQFFAEACAALELLAKHSSLMLIIDDLHWADDSTLSLFYHLSQRLKDLPVLFIAAYRTNEVKANQNSSLVKIINEFKRLYGKVTLDLNSIVEDEQEAFINSLT